MTRHRLGLALLLLAPVTGGAQRAVRVRADNDAFNFWQAPWNRPDEEYTSGVRLDVEYAGPMPLPGRHARAACDSVRAGCAAHSYAFGQSIYTAPSPNAQWAPPPGARPEAGVLWLSGAEQVTRGGRISERRITVGITGRPALAEQMQRFFHALAPAFNRPIDWSRQLPTEPVFALAYDERRPHAIGAARFEPHAGASLGTLLTELRGGMTGSLAVFRWLHLEGDATGRAVARSEVLSGTFFRPSDRVTLRPLVSEWRFGAHASWRQFSVAWSTHQTSAEYTGRSTPHAWSTLEAEWRR